MKAYRIGEKELEGLPLLATGYKIFNNDWTSKYGDYDYKDEQGKVLGTIHKVDGELSKCEHGLHFSRQAHDCFGYYESVQWNKFARVEAYGELKDCETKSIATILKIVQIYTFDELINEIQSNIISGGNYICGGNNIWGGNDIRGGNNIWGGNDIRGGNYIRGGNDIRGGNNIWGGNDICGGNCIWGARRCEGVSQCIFCYDFSGKLHVFNKPVEKARFLKIYNKLNGFSWYPKFNNAEELKGDLEWKETNIPKIEAACNKAAWSSMPKEMEQYIKSLPEFDEEIFNKIIGD